MDAFAGADLQRIFSNDRWTRDTVLSDERTRAV